MPAVFLIRRVLRLRRKISNQSTMEDCSKKLSALKQFIAAMESTMNNFPTSLKEQFSETFLDVKNSTRSLEKTQMVLKEERRVKSREIEDFRANVEINFELAVALERDVLKATKGTDYATFILKTNSVGQ